MTTASKVTMVRIFMIPVFIVFFMLGYYRSDLFGAFDIFAIVLFVLAVGLTVFIIIRIRRRKMKKTLEMEELAAMYKDEDDEMR